jgi:hypothetical protein
MFLLAGCDAVGGGYDLDGVDSQAGVAVETSEALDEARAAWRAAGIDDYEFRYDVSCYCAVGEVQVRVEGGAVAEVWIDGEPAQADPVVEAYTIDRLFEVAFDAFERADEAEARVLPGWAPFFLSLSVDYASAIADDEVSYTVTGFERLD